MLITYEQAGIEDFRRDGAKGIKRGSQILIPAICTYIENRCWKTIHNGTHGFELMFRTVDGYLGVAFIATDVTIGYQTHLWISPYYSTISRIRHMYHFGGVSGLFDSEGHEIG
jgi:hypothetical protein